LSKKLQYRGSWLVIRGAALYLSAGALEELSFCGYPRFSDLLRQFALAICQSFQCRELNFW